ncbi:hypothetical protein ACJOWW_18130 [Acinetobacter baumannii]|nr:hypothetical protein [Acinetobacter baumannii]
MHSKILLISTSYTNIESVIDELIISVNSLSSLELIIAKDLSKNEILDAISNSLYVFSIITDQWDNSLIFEEYKEIITEINLNKTRYWCVCDQKTIYARTILNELKFLDNLPELPEHDIKFLIDIYHTFIKNHEPEPSKRVGNWVHPYRTLDEISFYFVNQLVYVDHG